MRTKTGGKDLRLKWAAGFVHHRSIKIPGLFQDFPGPYLQQSRTSNSQENCNNLNKTNKLCSIFATFLHLMVYFAVDFRRFFKFSF